MTNSFDALFEQFEKTSTFQAEKLTVAYLAELNAHMKKAGVTNADLARRMDVSPAYITKVFRGPSNLSVETLVKLADAIGCKVHLHLARASAKVRWFDVVHDAHPLLNGGRNDKFDFVSVRDRLAPIYLQESNDEKFALAA